MDKTTRELFTEHVLKILDMSLSGDQFSTKTLGCMALLVNGFPDEPGDGIEAPNVIFLDLYKKAA